MPHRSVGSIKGIQKTLEALEDFQLSLEKKLGDSVHKEKKLRQALYAEYDRNEELEISLREEKEKNDCLKG